MAVKMPMIGLRVSPQLHARLRALAVKDGRSLANFVAVHLQAQFGPAPRKKPSTQSQPAATP